MALAMTTPVSAQQNLQANQPQAGATESEFAAYDADQSGKLDQSEFSSWYLAKADQQLSEAGKTASREELDGQVTLAFSQADADKDRVVTQQELERFLAG